MSEPSIIDRNAHIPSEEVRQDIRDTEREIADLTREETGLRMIGDKMSVFRADARATGISEREAFIAKLKALLVARGESA
jgi:hypothetical protein